MRLPARQGGSLRGPCQSLQTSSSFLMLPYSPGAGRAAWQGRSPLEKVLDNMSWETVIRPPFGIWVMLKGYRCHRT